MTWIGPAVCFSIDDVHPAPVAAEALAHVQWLQERHPQLRVTFFTTADWRTLDPYPTRRLAARLPVVRHRVFTVRTHPRGTFRLDRHEAFCAMLRQWPRAEVALHGLHHSARGLRPVQEFAGRSVRACGAIIREATEIFDRAKLPVTPGMSPPGWGATPQLLEAMRRMHFRFVASARDLDTAVSIDAVANGSGLRGVPLFRPHAIDGLVHFPTNFQATSTLDRALAIIEAGGLLSIKAHLLTESGAYRALDGLTPEYREHLHRVLGTLEERFGDAIRWTSMGEMAG